MRSEHSLTKNQNECAVNRRLEILTDFVSQPSETNFSFSPSIAVVFERLLDSGTAHILLRFISQRRN